MSFLRKTWQLDLVMARVDFRPRNGQFQGPGGGGGVQLPQDV